MDTRAKDPGGLPVPYVGCLLCLAWFALALDERVASPVTVLLAAGALGANLLSVRYRDALWISASFTCSLLAMVLLGPAAAFAVICAGELGAWVVERFRVRALAINVLGGGLPNLIGGTLLELAGRPDAAPLRFTFATVGVAVLALVLNFAIVASLSGPDRSVPLGSRLKPPSELYGALVWSAAAAVVTALAAEHIRSPLVGAACILAMLGFVHMLRLVVARDVRGRALARQQTGLIDALLRSLRERDPPAARHAAAVARFAGEIARTLGLPEETCRQAHAAGLLHDVGRSLLADAAVAGEGRLTVHAWRAIRRHPALGAEVLAGLGPVADAVGRHHERVDGLGYPGGLRGDDIPLLARIVAVAEVYDTLTAHDSYRPALGPLPALLELRRVSGTQLDADCVEALAQAVAGRPARERAGEQADFDAALAEERRRLTSPAPPRGFDRVPVERA